MKPIMEVSHIQFASSPIADSTEGILGKLQPVSYTSCFLRTLFIQDSSSSWIVSFQRLKLLAVNVWKGEIVCLSQAHYEVTLYRSAESKWLKITVVLKPLLYKTNLVITSAHEKY